LKRRPVPPLRIVVVVVVVVVVFAVAGVVAVVVRPVNSSPSAMNHMV
jgi:hypothetical protein